MKTGSVILLLAVICVSCFLPARASAGEDTAGSGAYNDLNGYFSFTPPAEWIKQELSQGYRSEVIFKSPDDAAVIVILAELDDGDLGSLFLMKKDLIRGHRQRYPEGTFEANMTRLGKFEAVGMDYEIPELSKKEFYFFYFDGIRFDLTYSVSNAADFARYRDTALNSFLSIEPKHRTLPQ